MMLDILFNVIYSLMAFWIRDLETDHHLPNQF